MKEFRSASAASSAAKIKGYASGGAVKADASDASSGMPKMRASGGGISLPIEGAAAKPRMDRPKKSSGKGGGRTNVNIIIAGKGGSDSPPPAAPAMALPPLPPPKPPMPPPMPPVAGPAAAPMPPPGLMRAAGGRVGMDSGTGSGPGRRDLSQIEGRGRK